MPGKMSVNHRPRWNIEGGIGRSDVLGRSDKTFTLLKKFSPTRFFLAPEPHCFIALKLIFRRNLMLFGLHCKPHQ